MRYIKLLVLAILLVGGGIGIYEIITVGGDDKGYSDIILSPEGKKLRDAIDALCTEEHWSISRYDSLASCAKVYSSQNIIPEKEAKSLQDLLYAKSCSFAMNAVSEYFQNYVYNDTEINSLNSMVQYLLTQPKREGSQNLDEPKEILSQYGVITDLLRRGMTYIVEEQLKKYDKEGKFKEYNDIDMNVKTRIENNRYYRSYFCNNGFIRNQVRSLSPSNKEDYLNALERGIEARFHTNRDVNWLLSVQSVFSNVAGVSYEHITRRLDNLLQN